MSADDEDSDLDEFIQSMLEELMPADTEDAPKVKPIFQAPTKQSKRTSCFPGTQPSFLPPGKRRQEDGMKEGLWIGNQSMMILRRPIRDSNQTTK
jgi:hypothetical protein